MYRELELKIGELEDIISCKITGEEDIEEIHIVASNNREYEQILKEVATVVLVDTQKKIDSGKISIAQVNHQKKSYQPNRIELISIYKENNKSTYHFKLNINGELIEYSLDSAYDRSIPISIAKGMVEVIEKYTAFPRKILVEHAFTTGIHNEIIVVQLVIYETIEKERLLGSVYIDQNLPLAIGKACLKALNRKLSL
ncbi:MAG: hypothetical protein ACOCQW_01735 [Halanaerobiaceae bacterium]